MDHFYRFAMTAARRLRGATRRTRLLIGAAWLAAVLSGTAAMLTYELTPGIEPPAPAHWPDASQLPRVSGRRTLVTFIHPRCPCATATFENLHVILRDAGDTVDVRTVVFVPAGAGDEWTRAAFVRRAKALPGSTTTLDPEGCEARLFNTRISGRALLYDADGGLLFDGGVTRARGHAGDSNGMAALRRLLAVSGRGEPCTAPVFGCAILSTQSEAMACKR